ncbi:MAG: hypothetical protein CK529_13670 [Rhodospirillaceae bacterium]|nr:MAG: hypothetical protein CK529_13670 [Rhodospirillaceae bacterium]
MIYNAARPSVRSGDLIAQSGGSWLDWHGIKINLVRMFTRSTYSHVGVAWVVGGRVFMLEAVKPAQQAAAVRANRNARLAATDWTQIADSTADKPAWAAYRQALRDVPAQVGFPQSVEWPRER